jgi:hypothetical protein
MLLRSTGLSGQEESIFKMGSNTLQAGYHPAIDQLPGESTGPWSLDKG